jgi:hypothetical protein
MRDEARGKRKGRGRQKGELVDGKGEEERRTGMVKGGRGKQRAKGKGQRKGN